ncbi:imidazole glycerol phosphate synthase subunit HisF [candidate division WOR-3 bacterium]|nr:imidazole glycerol phosphate synthase subunit HisF [candidate division WOR-3 bacterium]
MLATRVIACLDIEGGRVVKGVAFKGLRDAGDPVERARLYNDMGADELVFLDVGASYKSREILISVVEHVSQQVFIPLTVGGGIRSVEDMRKVLCAGADKVALCTAAIADPGLIDQGASAFGSQCIVISIDAKQQGNTWHAYTHGGRNDSGRDAVAWAQEAVKRGAGEILLNSIDMDGTQEGYNLALTAAISTQISVPVIASGGAGALDHMVEAVQRGKADAVLLASLLHFNTYTIEDIKKHLEKKGVCVRW